MSNLLKGFVYARPADEKRVIDSNALISEKLIKVREAAENGEFTEAGFNPGLNPMGVSELIADKEHVIGGEIDEAALEAAKAAEEEKRQKRDRILAEAQAEAEAIIAKANEDARVIISQSQSQSEDIKKQAREQGYAEGKAKASDEVREAIAQKEMEFETLKSQIVSEYRQKESEMEPVLVDTILKIFSEITQAIALDKRDMILTLVNNVMSGGEASRNFVIRVCNEDAIFLKENKEKIIGAVRKDIHIEIVTDPSMKRNECLIDTDTGVYDCSLDIQLENLINDIKILSCAGE